VLKTSHNEHRWRRAARQACEIDNSPHAVGAFARDPARSLDAVIAAAILCFGFVNIHPFEDGNGRIHRYLIHHLLAERGFNPPGVVPPVSSAMLERIDAYRTVLETYSERLVPLIEWEPTESFNVRVTNEFERIRVASHFGDRGEHGEPAPHRR